MKAKKTSLIGMIIGAVCLGTLFVISIIKFFKGTLDISLEQTESMILLGVAPSIPFCPVFLSIMLDKINEIKNGKVNNTTTDVDISETEEQFNNSEVL